MTESRESLNGHSEAMQEVFESLNKIEQTQLKAEKFSSDLLIVSKLILRELRYQRKDHKDAMLKKGISEGLLISILVLFLGVFIVFEFKDSNKEFKGTAPGFSAEIKNG